MSHSEWYFVSLLSPPFSVAAQSYQQCHTKNPSPAQYHHPATSHREPVTQILATILSTPLAAQTYAQIIDGLPVRDVRNAYECRRRDIHIHVEPCAEATQVWEAFGDHFQCHILQFDAPFVQAYQNCTVGTKDFNLRLPELSVVACHEIAALLYKNADGGVSIHEERPTPQVILDANR